VISSRRRIRRGRGPLAFSGRGGDRLIRWRRRKFLGLRARLWNLSW